MHKLFCRQSLLKTQLEGQSSRKLTDCCPRTQAPAPFGAAFVGGKARVGAAWCVTRLRVSPRALLSCSPRMGAREVARRGRCAGAPPVAFLAVGTSN